MSYSWEGPNYQGSPPSNLQDPLTGISISTKDTCKPKHAWIPKQLCANQPAHKVLMHQLYGDCLDDNDDFQQCLVNEIPSEIDVSRQKLVVSGEDNRYFLGLLATAFAGQNRQGRKHSTDSDFSNDEQSVNVNYLGKKFSNDPRVQCLLYRRKKERLQARRLCKGVHSRPKPATSGTHEQAIKSDRPPIVTRLKKQSVSMDGSTTIHWKVSSAEDTSKESDCASGNNNKYNPDHVSMRSAFVQDLSTADFDQNRPRHHSVPSHKTINTEPTKVCNSRKRMAKVTACSKSPAKRKRVESTCYDNSSNQSSYSSDSDSPSSLHMNSGSGDKITKPLKVFTRSILQEKYSNEMNKTQGRAVNQTRAVNLLFEDSDSSHRYKSQQPVTTINSPKNDSMSSPLQLELSDKENSLPTTKDCPAKTKKPVSSVPKLKRCTSEIKMINHVPLKRSWSATDMTSEWYTRHRSTVPFSFRFGEGLDTIDITALLPDSVSGLDVKTADQASSSSFTSTGSKRFEGSKCINPIVQESVDYEVGASAHSDKTCMDFENESKPILSEMKTVQMSSVDSRSQSPFHINLCSGTRKCLSASSAALSVHSTGQSFPDTRCQSSNVTVAPGADLAHTDKSKQPLFSPLHPQDINPYTPRMPKQGHGLQQQAMAAFGHSGGISVNRNLSTNSKTASGKEAIPIHDHKDTSDLRSCLELPIAELNPADFHWEQKQKMCQPHQDVDIYTRHTLEVTQAHKQEMNRFTVENCSKNQDRVTEKVAEEEVDLHMEKAAKEEVDVLHMMNKHMNHFTVENCSNNQERAIEKADSDPLQTINKMIQRIKKTDENQPTAISSLGLRENQEHSEVLSSEKASDQDHAVKQPYSPISEASNDGCDQFEGIDIGNFGRSAASLFTGNMELGYRMREIDQQQICRVGRVLGSVTGSVAEGSVGSFLENFVDSFPESGTDSVTGRGIGSFNTGANNNSCQDTFTSQETPVPSPARCFFEDAGKGLLTGQWHAAKTLTQAYTNKPAAWREHTGNINDDAEGLPEAQSDSEELQSYTRNRDYKFSCSNPNSPCEASDNHINNKNFVTNKNLNQQYVKKREIQAESDRGKQFHAELRMNREDGQWHPVQTSAENSPSDMLYQPHPPEPSEVHTLAIETSHFLETDLTL